MAGDISDALLSEFSEFVAARMGLRFSAERRRDLERGIICAAHEFGFKDAESCVRRLVSSPLTRNQIEILAGHLTVGETYFFRDQKIFEVLEQQILPDLIRTKEATGKRLRIWSAGCCTGEEPYSIAMLLDRRIPDQRDWNITILATDINPSFLRKASEGAYTGWSFRDVPPWIKEGYFKSEKEGRFKIAPFLKKGVVFSYLNLAEDVYPSLTNNTNAMDVIFCRNVLMYFDKERAQKVAQNLFHSLVDGGWLIVSPSETSTALFSQFATVNYPGVILYKKDASKPHKGEALSEGLPEEPTISFRPLRDFTAGPEVPVFQEIRESFPLEIEKPEAAEPPPTLYMDALALYERGCYTDAADKIQGWLLHRPDDAKATALLARIYANQGKLTEALQGCERAIAADKLNPGYHYLYATILQEQGRVDEAIFSLKRSLYLDANFVLAHFALGNLAQQQGRSGESEKHFRNALSLLRARRREEILPESEGITAGRLLEILRSTARREASA